VINTKKKDDIIDENDIPKSVRKMKHAREKADLVEEKKKNRKKKIRKLIFFFLIILALFFIIKLAISAHRWKMLAKDMLVNEHSVILDSDGTIIATLGDEKKKEKISYDSIPKNLKNAYVAIEDERFYSHSGIDIKRTAAASASYILHFGSSSFGGSTITQQLVKNLTGDSSDKISRKVKEWWKAWQLESCTSKEEILCAYLNNIYVGPNIYGVEAGAKYYFSKSASDLSLEECAFLAGINHSPNSYNPFVNDDISEKISKRSKLVLGKMKEFSYISNQEYDEAVSNLDSGLKFQKGAIEAGSHVYSYHTDALISQVTKEIADKYKISETFATNYLELAGAKIYSTQISSVQKEIETEFEKTKYSLASKNGGSSSQAAMVVIDHKCGYIVGCARWVR
jgi:penicillin-binding protein 1A